MKARDHIRRFGAAEDGSVVVEYTVLVGAMAAVVIVAMAEFGQVVSGLYEGVTAAIRTAS
ncbi:MAG: hypothetical protein R3F55_19375 [Alphaproteobacteria bacterium]